MRMNAGWSRSRFVDARVGRLATADENGRPHLVPFVFAVAGDDIVTVVDAKPKDSPRLRRLANIQANPAVSALVDHYDDDWNQLWWARADGTARIVQPDDRPADALEALAGRYPQYRDEPPPGPLIVITVDRWSGWTAVP